MRRTYYAIVVFIILGNQLSAQIYERIGGGNSDSVLIQTSSSEFAQPGENTMSGIGLLPNLNAASRFLGQATLGANYELIDSVSRQGISDWLDDQFAEPASFSMEGFLRDMRGDAIDSLIANGGDSSQYNLPDYYFGFAWWQYVMTAPDLLRARVALALSEIIVVSEVPDLRRYPLALVSWYDMLIQNAFGNYRDILGDATRHPAMANYLTYLRNPKTDTTQNRFPDENYAREIMQLFTIGLYMLNNDGTLQLDSAGNSIPTYNNYYIAELAKVFTGYTWGNSSSWYDYFPNEDSYTVPLKMYDEWHEPGAKELILDYTIQARDPVDGEADVDEALDHLFNHPNVGPFISYRLIQRLITSNPSPEYVDRVASVFNDNGQGVRGDLEAVVRAILLDKEARDCDGNTIDHFGMLREPLVRYTHLARAFDAAAADGYNRNTMRDFYDDTEQRPLASPTVFNFFSPDYQPLGPIADNNLYGPEFQITHSQSIIGWASRLYEMTDDPDDIFEWSRLYSGEEYTSDKDAYLDLTDEILLSDNRQFDDLVERLDLILCHGNMSSNTHNYIRDAIAQVPDNQSELRTRMAIFLTMISPDYLIMR